MCTPGISTIWDLNCHPKPANQKKKKIVIPSLNHVHGSDREPPLENRENWVRIVNPRPKCCLALRSRNSKLLQVLPLFLKSACVPYQLGSIFAKANTSLPNCNRNPQVCCNVPRTSITVDVHQFVNHFWVDFFFFDKFSGLIVSHKHLMPIYRLWSYWFQRGMVDGLILVMIPKFDMAQIKINAKSKSKNIKIKYPRNQYLSSLGISLESTPSERKQT